jgi:glyoxylase-like metal-dependent hydrolase (beta-lactamase superfamily II)
VISASELTHVCPHYAIWQAYDPAVKAELFSTATQTANGLLIFDPIPLAADVGAELERMGKVAAVIVTNTNHARAAGKFAVGCTVVIPAELRDDFPDGRSLVNGSNLYGLNILKIEGAAPGEFAFYDERNGGAVIVGDALIHFGASGFALLPSKYCTNQKKMVRSLRRLLELEFTRLFFAHGDPIISHARERLSALLEDYER